MWCRAWVLALAAFAAGLLWPAEVVRGDGESAALEGYLRSRGMPGLAAELLERELDRIVDTDSAAFVSAAERLAELYTSLLAGAESAEERRRWRRAGEGLLDRLPGAAVLGLRLGVLRASYDAHESTVNLARLGAASPAARAEASAGLRSLHARFRDLASYAGRHVSALEREEERATSNEAELLALALERARRERSMAAYLAAWSGVWAAWLEDDRRLAAESLRDAGVLLNAERGSAAEVSRVPPAHFRLRHVAQAASSSALAEAIRGRHGDAAGWLGAIERLGGVDPAADDDLFRTSLLAMSLGGRWEDLGRLVGARRAVGEGELGLTDARLVAATALAAISSGGRESSGARRLRDDAMAELVNAGAFAHVLDLTRRFGTPALGDGTAVGQIARALRLYDEARTRHAESGDAERATEDEDLRRRYREAASLFAGVVEGDGGALTGPMVSRAALLAGLCLVYAGDDPTGWFLRAASSSVDGATSADAAWLAIRALEEHGGPGAESERRSLSASFIERFPDDSRASALRLSMASSERDDPERAISLLLGVPESSEHFDAARRAASRAAYDAFRGAGPDRRGWAARRYLEIAGPLLAADVRAASSEQDGAGSLAGSGSAARAVARGQRMLDAALAGPSPDVRAAERALDVVRSLIARGWPADGSLSSALSYRAAQIALALGDVQRADAEVAALVSSGSDLAEPAGRLVFAAAHTRWLRRRDLGPGPGSDEALALARLVVERGSLVLTPTVLASGEAIPEASVGDAVAVVLAGIDLHAHAGDESAGRAVVSLGRRLIEAGVGTPAMLAGVAVAAAAGGELALALEVRRRLVASLEPGSDAWFEARAAHLELLAEVDGGRALEAIEQHGLLHPGYGPEPWGPRIAALHASLRAEGAGGS